MTLFQHIEFKDVWKSPESDPPLNESGNELIDKFTMLIRENYTARLTYYAEKLEMASEQLNLLMKTFTGISAQEWRNRLMLADAKWYLLYTEHPIQEIATKMHFAKHQGFSDFFRRQAWISPRRFRKRNQVVVVKHIFGSTTPIV